MNRLVMLDLNDTLIEPSDDARHPGWVTRDTEWSLMPGAQDALRLFVIHGWRMALVTNQPAERCFDDVTHEQMVDTLEHIRQDLESCCDVGTEGIGLHVCYHEGADDCICRKPLTLLLSDAMSDMWHSTHILEDPLTFMDAWMVGDKWSDVLAGQRAGVRTCMVGPAFGYAQKGDTALPDDLKSPDLWVPDILTAAKVITGVRF